MSTQPALFKDFANYLAGRGLLILLGFITFPLLTRLLSVDEYGIVSLTLRLVLVLVVLSKCGLQYSAGRFFNATSSDPAEQRRFYSTLLLCPTLISIGVSAIYVSILFRSPVVRKDTLLFHCLLLAPVAVVMRTLQSMMLSFLRNEGRSRLHTIIEVSTKLSALAGFAGLAIGGRHQGFLVLVATFAGEFLVIATQFVGMLRRRLIDLAAVDWTLIRESLLFGIPLIAYELSSLVLDSADRLIVQHYLGDHSLGLYSAAYGISGYLQDTVMTPLNLALFPIYMRIWTEQGKEATARFLSKALSWFIVVALFIVGTSALCSSQTLVLLASHRFEAANRLLLVLIPALMVYALHIFFNVGLILEKRTGQLAAIAVSSALLNVVANIFWVPRFGLMGAASATLISYIVMVGALIILSRHLLPVRPSRMIVGAGLFSMLLAYPLPSLIHLHWLTVEVMIKALVYAATFATLMAAISGQFRGLVRTLVLKIAARVNPVLIPYTSVSTPGEGGAQ